MASRKKLGELLVDAGAIDQLQLQAALGFQRQWGGKLGTVLIDRGFITEPRLMEVLSQQLKVPVVHLTKTRIDARAVAIVPAGVAEQLHIFPVEIKGVDKSETLTVAMSDPTDLGAIDQLQFRTRKRIQAVLAGEKDIAAAIQRHYRKEDELVADAAGNSGPQPALSMTDVDMLGGESDIVPGLVPWGGAEVRAQRPSGPNPTAQPYPQPPQKQQPYYGQQQPYPPQSAAPVGVPPGFVPDNRGKPMLAPQGARMPPSVDPFADSDANMPDPLAGLDPTETKPPPRQPQSLDFDPLGDDSDDSWKADIEPIAATVNGPYGRSPPSRPPPRDPLGDDPFADGDPLGLASIPTPPPPRPMPRMAPPPHPPIPAPAQPIEARSATSVDDGEELEMLDIEALDEEPNQTGSRWTSKSKKSDDAVDAAAEGWLTPTEEPSGDPAGEAWATPSESTDDPWRTVSERPEPSAIDDESDPWATPTDSPPAVEAPAAIEIEEAQTIVARAPVLPKPPAKLPVKPPTKAPARASSGEDDWLERAAHPPVPEPAVQDTSWLEPVGASITHEPVEAGSDELELATPGPVRERQEAWSTEAAEVDAATEEPALTEQGWGDSVADTGEHAAQWSTEAGAHETSAAAEPPDEWAASTEEGSDAPAAWETPSEPESALVDQTDEAGGAWEAAETEAPAADTAGQWGAGDDAPPAEEAAAWATSGDEEAAQDAGVAVEQAADGPDASTWAGEPGSPEGGEAEPPESGEAAAWASDAAGEPASSETPAEATIESEAAVWASGGDSVAANEQEAPSDSWAQGETASHETAIEPTEATEAPAAWTEDATGISHEQPTDSSTELGGEQPVELSEEQAAELSAEPSEQPGELDEEQPAELSAEPTEQPAELDEEQPAELSAESTEQPAELDEEQPAGLDEEQAAELSAEPAEQPAGLDEEQAAELSAEPSEQAAGLDEEQSFEQADEQATETPLSLDDSDATGWAGEADASASIEGAPAEETALSLDAAPAEEAHRDGAVETVETVAASDEEAWPTETETETTAEAEAATETETALDIDAPAETPASLEAASPTETETAAAEAETELSLSDGEPEEGEAAALVAEEEREPEAKTAAEEKPVAEIEAAPTASVQPAHELEAATAQAFAEAAVSAEPSPAEPEQAAVEAEAKPIEAAPAALVPEAAEAPTGDSAQAEKPADVAAPLEAAATTQTIEVAPAAAEAIEEIAVDAPEDILVEIDVDTDEEVPAAVEAAPAVAEPVLEAKPEAAAPEPAPAPVEPSPEPVSAAPEAPVSKEPPPIEDDWAGFGFKESTRPIRIERPMVAEVAEALVPAAELKPVEAQPVGLAPAEAVLAAALNGSIAPAIHPGWSRFGIANPTADDAVKTMGLVLDLLMSKGSVSAEDLARAIQEAHERTRP